jgi:hypothetical protein
MTDAVLVNGRQYAWLARIDRTAVAAKLHYRAVLLDRFDIRLRQHELDLQLKEWAIFEACFGRQPAHPDDRAALLEAIVNRFGLSSAGGIQ